MHIQTHPPVPGHGAADPMAGADRQSFRDGMARLAASVNIVTTMAEGQPFGFTASAVSSVTDAPPTLLVCVNRQSQSHPVLRDSGILCINTLAQAHGDLAMLFAGGSKDMGQRFAAASWTEGASGAPVLTDALVSFDCHVAEVVTAGTHDIFLCRVLKVHEGGGSQALVYCDREFRALAPA